MNKIKLYFQENQAAVTVGTALILAVIIGGIFYATKTTGGNLLTVTGSAKVSVTSDRAAWRVSITRNVPAGDLKSGYASLANDLSIVQAFLAKNKIDAGSVIVSPVSANPDYNQNGGAPQSYTLRQGIEIGSNDVNAITAIAGNIKDIVNQGVLFQTDSLEYYYSKLPDARVSLLKDATTDARARADAMASSSGQHVGKLQSASSGIVQVLSKGAIDNGDYGQYDTSKIEKDITVTVRATFKLR